MSKDTIRQNNAGMPLRNDFMEVVRRERATNSVGRSERRTMSTRRNAFAIDRGEDVADRYTYTDSDHTADILLGARVVQQWRLIGDTPGDDMGNDEGDDDAHVSVTIKPLSITLQEIGGCTP
jgi:hypothetical protein